MPPPLLELHHASPSDFTECRDLLCQGSRTFFVASLLLPRAVSDPATALYAFCRQADDTVDQHGGGGEAMEALRERLARAYEGRPLPSAVDRAFADVVASFAIPRDLPEALLDGIEWDAQGYRYEDLSSLCAYAARVAGTVGGMMAIVMGARHPDTVARACDLGVAMQLSNIARDVGEDARAGRVYLPLQWLREAAIDPDAWLAEPRFSAALGSVVQRLLRFADGLYERAEGGIDRLPLTCRPAIFAARHLYAEIGREVERAGLDSVSRRAIVSGRRKVPVVARALAATGLRGRSAAAPVLEEVRFLVDAVVDAHLPNQHEAKLGQANRGRTMDEQVGWVVDLFLRLEHRDRLQRAAGEA